MIRSLALESANLDPRAMARRSRVPAALHSELTEYASLLRALRTQHTLDLSVHLSQLPPRANQQYEDEESELNLSDEETSAGRRQKSDVLLGQVQSKRPSREIGTETTSRETTIQLSDRQESTEVDKTSILRTSKAPEAKQRKTQTGKKRKRSATDTWTRWPLLAGDVYRPEWGLADEVQLVVSQAHRQRRSASSPHTRTEAQDSESESDFEDELSEVASRALTASSAEHLRALLSVCSAHVPRVDSSLRSRLAPLNWTSILAAAGASGLVSPEILERVQARLEALYSGPVSTLQGSKSSTKETLSSLTRPIHQAATSVQAARENLHSLLASRVEQGDGDFLSFLGPLPPRPPPKERKKARRKLEKEETAVLSQVKKEFTEQEDVKENSEMSTSESTSDDASGEESASEHEPVEAGQDTPA